MTILDGRVRPLLGPVLGDPLETDGREAFDLADRAVWGRLPSPVYDQTRRAAPRTAVLGAA